MIMYVPFLSQPIQWYSYRHQKVALLQAGKNKLSIQVNFSNQHYNIQFPACKVYVLHDSVRVIHSVTLIFVQLVLCCNIHAYCYVPLQSLLSVAYTQNCPLQCRLALLLVLCVWRNFIPHIKYAKFLPASRKFFTNFSSLQHLLSLAKFFLFCIHINLVFVLYLQSQIQ